MTIDKKIKLLASTEYDLDIISHLCQDAILSKDEFFFDKENKIFLHFSKSREIILKCKKISILIEDIDIPWPTKLKPNHNVK